MNIAKRLAAVALLGLAAGGAGLAPTGDGGDWPQFHGPARDNISKETGLLKEWPKVGPTLVWRTAGLGAGFSAVSAAGGKLYTAGDLSDASYVFALNEADGKVLWKSKLGRTGGQHDAGPRATPTVDGELIYMMGQFGDLACYQAADGKEVWQKNLNKEFSGKVMKPGWGNTESVVVDGEKLICSPGGPEGTIRALNKKTGETLWRTDGLIDDSSYTAPVLTEIGGVRQAVVLTEKRVAGVAMADGKVLWKIDRFGKTAVIPTPVVKDNYVYVTSGYGIGCDLFKISGSAGGGDFKAEKVYSNTNMVNHHGGVILLDNSIYGYSDKGGWTCQDLLTGEVKWQDRKLLGKGTISYADGRFYLRDEKTGEIVLLDAGPDHHDEKGRFQTPDRTPSNAWSHLVIAHGRMYVRDQNNLFAYDLKAK